MAATYEPIASHTLTGWAFEYTFSAIPGTFTDLVAVVFAQDIAVSGNVYAWANGDNGTNYSATELVGTGSSATSGRASNTSSGFRLGHTGGGFAGNEFGITIAHFLSYANPNVYKTVLSTGESASAYVTRRVSLWRSTAAITSLTFFGGIDDFQPGTTLSLYGIKGA